MTVRAALPGNESQRLTALAAYDVLDTPPELAFDRLTSLAAELCEAPTALISLIDRDRQWFKSRFGLDAPETPRDVAFCAHAILKDEVLVIPDATLDERFKDNPLVTGPPHIRAYAGAPLIARDGIKIGTLCVIHDKVTHLSARQISQLERLAAIAVDELELRLALKEVEIAQERLEARAEELRFANSTLEGQAAQLVQMAEEREQLYIDNDRERRFVETLLETVPIPIFSRDERQRITHVNPAYASFLGLRAERILGKHIGELYEHEHVLEIEEQDRRLAADPTGHQTYERRVTRDPEACRDIILHKALMRAHDGSIEGVVGAVVDMTDQKALQAELQHLATTDQLTGAANRRAFMEKAEAELRRSLRYGHPLSLIMIDVDRFKSINDTHGHHAGDRVLQRICRICLETIRDSVDYFSRLGGEEFAVLAPETGAQGAGALAERLRQGLANERFIVEGQTIPFTASFGVATCEAGNDGATVEGLLKQADRCLYESKSNGRNRVTLAAPAMAAKPSPLSAKGPAKVPGAASPSFCAPNGG